MKYVEERVRRSPELMRGIHATGEGYRGCCDRGILALVNEQRLRRILARMLDEQEFLSPHGIRSLSRFHADHPYVFDVHGDQYRVATYPAESDSGMFGGNSNWRGPVWFPVNALIVRALLQFYAYYGDTFKIRCPTRTGPSDESVRGCAAKSARRLDAIWQRGPDGRRPVFGGQETFQTDPHWRDLTALLRVLPRRQRRRPRGQPSDRLDRTRRDVDPVLRRVDSQRFLERGPIAVTRPVGARAVASPH